MNERISIMDQRPKVKSQNRLPQIQRKKNHSKTKNSPVDRILFLQRTAGNQAVQRLIKSGALQAKLRIGQPGDIYEQEADRVAEQVMRMSEPQAVSSGTSYIHSIQRARIRSEDEVLSRQPIEKEDELHRQPIEEEEEELQAKATSGSISEVNPDIKSHIQNMRGGGQPLSESARAYFEPRFGQDFSQVRVHSDAKAAESARVVNAKAYTVGKDVIFGAGLYAPGTGPGQRLIAHELTHVVQQTGSLQRPASMTSSIKIGEPGDTFERKADRVAGQVSFGTDKVPHNLEVSSPSIQRTCGSSAIIAMALPSCSGGDHTFVPGTMFKFNMSCDDFAPGQEAALISFTSTLPPTATLEIHSYASVDAATFNEQLSCARSSKAKSVLTDSPPSGAGIAASRIIAIVNHGPTPGPAAERRSVVIRTSTPTPTAPPTPTPTSPVPTVDCTATNISEISPAIPLARDMVRNAIRILGLAPTPEVSALMRKYFNDDSVSTRLHALIGYKNLLAGITGSFTIECEQPSSFMYSYFCGGTNAYVRIVPWTNVHLCGLAFGRSATDLAQTIVHESSHKFDSTDDEAYCWNGCPSSLDRWDAYDNADSFSKFAWDAYLNVP